MLYGPDDFDQALAEARAAKAAGQEYLTLEIVPVGIVTRYINLWEGCFGEIKGRVYYEDRGATWNPDLPPERTVRAVRVRVNVIDLLNAGARRAKRVEKEIASPLKANRVAPVSSPSTSR